MVAGTLYGLWQAGLVRVKETSVIPIAEVEKVMAATAPLFNFRGRRFNRLLAGAAAAQGSWPWLSAASGGSLLVFNITQGIEDFFKTLRNAPGNLIHRRGDPPDGFSRDPGVASVRDALSLLVDGSRLAAYLPPRVDAFITRDAPGGMPFIDRFRYLDGFAQVWPLVRRDPIERRGLTLAELLGYGGPSVYTIVQLPAPPVPARPKHLSVAGAVTTSFIGETVMQGTVGEVALAGVSPGPLLGIVTYWDRGAYTCRHVCPSGVLRYGNGATESSSGATQDTIWWGEPPQFAGVAIGDKLTIMGVPGSELVVVERIPTGGFFQIARASTSAAYSGASGSPILNADGLPVGVYSFSSNELCTFETADAILAQVSGLLPVPEAEAKRLAPSAAAQPGDDEEKLPRPSTPPMDWPPPPASNDSAEHKAYLQLLAGKSLEYVGRNVELPVHAVTGSGKTTVFIKEMSVHYPRVLVVLPWVAAATQLADFARHFELVSVDTDFAGHRTSQLVGGSRSHLTIVTAARAVDFYLSKADFDCVVVDEYHDSSALTQTVLSFVRQRVKLPKFVLSASPVGERPIYPKQLSIVVSKDPVKNLSDERTLVPSMSFMVFYATKEQCKHHPGITDKLIGSRRVLIVTSDTKVDAIAIVAAHRDEPMAIFATDAALSGFNAEVDMVAVTPTKLEPSYDFDMRVASLKERPRSVCEVTQGAGRAGRHKPGKAFVPDTANSRDFLLAPGAVFEYALRCVAIGLEPTSMARPEDRRVYDLVLKQGSNFAKAVIDFPDPFVGYFLCDSTGRYPAQPLQALCGSTLDKRAVKRLLWADTLLRRTGWVATDQGSVPCVPLIASPAAKLVSALAAWDNSNIFPSGSGGPYLGARANGGSLTNHDAALCAERAASPISRRYQLFGAASRVIRMASVLGTFNWTLYRASKLLSRVCFFQNITPAEVKVESAGVLRAASVTSVVSAANLLCVWALRHVPNRTYVVTAPKTARELEAERNRLATNLHLKSLWTDSYIKMLPGAAGPRALSVGTITSVLYWYTRLSTVYQANRLLGEALYCYHTAKGPTAALSCNVLLALFELAAQWLPARWYPVPPSTLVDLHAAAFCRGLGIVLRLLQDPLYLRARDPSAALPPVATLLETACQLSSLSWLADHVAGYGPPPSPDLSRPVFSGRARYAVGVLVLSTAVRCLAGAYAMHRGLGSERFRPTAWVALRGIIGCLSAAAMLRGRRGLLPLSVAGVVASRLAGLADFNVYPPPGRSDPRDGALYLFTTVEGLVAIAAACAAAFIGRPALIAPIRPFQAAGAAAPARQNMLIVAPSGSGKTWAAKQWPHLFVDMDTLFTWPDRHPSSVRWWEHASTAARVNAANSIVLRRFLSQHDGRIGLYADDLVGAAVAYVDIPEEELKANLVRRGDHTGQPTIYDYSRREPPTGVLVFSSWEAVVAAFGPPPEPPSLLQRCCARLLRLIAGCSSSPFRSLSASHRPLAQAPAVIADAPFVMSRAQRDVLAAMALCSPASLRPTPVERELLLSLELRGLSRVSLSRHAPGWQITPLGLRALADVDRRSAWLIATEGMHPRSLPMAAAAGGVVGCHTIPDWLKAVVVLKAIKQVDAQSAAAFAVSWWLLRRLTKPLAKAEPTPPPQHFSGKPAYLGASVLLPQAPTKSGSSWLSTAIKIAAVSVVVGRMAQRGLATHHHFVTFDGVIKPETVRTTFAFIDHVRKSLLFLRNPFGWSPATLHASTSFLVACKLSNDIVHYLLSGVVFRSALDGKLSSKDKESSSRSVSFTAVAVPSISWAATPKALVSVPAIILGAMAGVALATLEFASIRRDALIAVAQANNKPIVTSSAALGYDLRPRDRRMVSALLCTAAGVLNPFSLVPVLASHHFGSTNLSSAVLCASALACIDPAHEVASFVSVAGSIIGTAAHPESLASILSSGAVAAATIPHMALAPEAIGWRDVTPSWFCNGLTCARDHFTIGMVPARGIDSASHALSLFETRGHDYTVAGSLASALAKAECGASGHVLKPCEDIVSTTSDFIPTTNVVPFDMPNVRFHGSCNLLMGTTPAHSRPNYLGQEAAVLLGAAASCNVTVTGSDMHSVWLGIPSRMGRDGLAKSDAVWPLAISTIVAVGATLVERSLAPYPIALRSMSEYWNKDATLGPYEQRHFHASVLGDVADSDFFWHHVESTYAALATGLPAETAYFLMGKVGERKPLYAYGRILSFMGGAVRVVDGSLVKPLSLAVCQDNRDHFCTPLAANPANSTGLSPLDFGRRLLQRWLGFKDPVGLLWDWRSWDGQVTTLEHRALLLAQVLIFLVVLAWSATLRGDRAERSACLKRLRSMRVESRHPAAVKFNRSLDRYIAAAQREQPPALPQWRRLAVPADLDAIIRTAQAEMSTNWIDAAGYVRTKAGKRNSGRDLTSVGNSWQNFGRDTIFTLSAFDLDPFEALEQGLIFLCHDGDDSVAIVDASHAKLFDPTHNPRLAATLELAGVVFKSCEQVNSFHMINYDSQHWVPFTASDGRSDVAMLRPGPAQLAISSVTRRSHGHMPSIASLGEWLTHWETRGALYPMSRFYRAMYLVARSVKPVGFELRPEDYFVMMAGERYDLSEFDIVKFISAEYGYNGLVEHLPFMASDLELDVHGGAWPIDFATLPDLVSHCRAFVASLPLTAIGIESLSFNDLPFSSCTPVFGPNRVKEPDLIPQRAMSLPTPHVFFGCTEQAIRAGVYGPKSYSIADSPYEAAQVLKFSSVHAVTSVVPLPGPLSRSCPRDPGTIVFGTYSSVTNNLARASQALFGCPVLFLEQLLLWPATEGGQISRRDWTRVCQTASAISLQLANYDALASWEKERKSFQRAAIGLPDPQASA
jgi:hypothetical protein